MFDDCNGITGTPPVDIVKRAFRNHSVTNYDRTPTIRGKRLRSAANGPHDATVIYINDDDDDIVEEVESKKQRVVNYGSSRNKETLGHLQYSSLPNGKAHLLCRRNILLLEILLYMVILNIHHSVISSLTLSLQNILQAVVFFRSVSQHISRILLSLLPNKHLTIISNNKHKDLMQLTASLHHSQKTFQCLYQKHCIPMG